WLCGELGLPVLEETAAGLVANQAAQQALHEAGSESSGGLAASAAAVMGIDADDEDLLDAVASARRGGHGRAEVSSGGQLWRVVATPLGDSARVRLTCAPSARQADQGWSEVAAAVSHEVANAVGAIRGWADLALHGNDATVNTRDALTLIHGAARSAEQAARGMLRLARSNAGNDEPNTVDLSEFASELMSLLALGARESRVSLQSSIEPGLFVRATRAQLFTMLFNLLKNGVEACQPGGLVSLSASAAGDGVQVLVRDTGAGLDSEAKQRLFDRYFTTKASGTGLGLALVKHAVDATGASIRVESALGQGTEFQLRLPRVHEVVRIEPAAQPSAHGLRARVLLVDDDHALREMLATALSLRGAEVISVRSAEEALAQSGPFEIALIDMMLEGCRGDELLARLRKRGIVNAAMLVTGTVQKPRLVPGGEPDDWVRKPFDLAHLAERIRRTLERHRMLLQASPGVRV
ncbi:MAG TPA: hybrid sensor histidine kinase/response regulator, partial [Polyangiales bacterium]|nr:hybrid sensor histidine kinase/response regulator [Polyangiales bacterium]